MTQQTLGQPLLGAENLVQHFGAQPILEDVTFSVHEGDRLGLIGRNGCGKSTLLRILAGADVPENGKVTRRRGLRVTLLRQSAATSPNKTVGAVLREAAGEMRAVLAEHHALSDALAAGWASGEEQKRLAAIQQLLDVHDAWHFEAYVERLGVGLRLPPMDRPLDTLSGGERRRVDLAAALAHRPDVLLLDEPTNHIDVGSVEWLENFLANYAGACVLVTHDRYFLERVVTRIAELAHGRVETCPGNYGAYLERKAAREAVELRTESNRQSAMKRELEWLRRAPKARGTKAKARIQQYDAMAEQDGPAQDASFDFSFPTPPRLSKRILEADEVGHSLGGAKLFEGFSLILQKGMRIGLAGPNGCGKTTLLRVLMGKLTPSEGSIVVGESTRFLYVDQGLDTVDPAATVLQYVSNGVDYMDAGPNRIYIPAYLERFLFDRTTLAMPMGELSGGERRRVDLAKKFLRGGNVLVLDEPTNDLDLYTLRVLEDAVLSFQGPALIVSHDRYFLNRLCTDIVVFEGQGQAVRVAGNWDDYRRYAAERGKERKAEAEKAAAKAKHKPSVQRDSRRLTYKEKQELDSMEDRIHSSEAEVARLEAEMARPAFYQRPEAELRNALAAYEEAKAAVDTLYARWDELESRSSA